VGIAEEQVYAGHPCQFFFICLGIATGDRDFGLGVRPYGPPHGLAGLKGRAFGHDAGVDDIDIGLLTGCCFRPIFRLKLLA
jgi:hypothetical protein